MDWLNKKYVLQLFLWTIGVLIVLELILRIFVYRPVPRYVNDPVWGRRPAGGSIVFWAIEGNGTTHYVADGEISTPYSGGDNIVVLGDSHTEAWQVNDDEKYVSVAERELHQSNSPVDLRNLGFANGSIADYVYLAPFVISQYHPKLVVIQLSDNDFWGNSGFDATRTNYFVQDSNGQVEIRHIPLLSSDPWYMPIRGLAIAAYAYNRLQTIQELQLENTIPSPSTDSQVLLDEHNIEQLQALSTAYSRIPTIVIVLPYNPKIVNDHIEFLDPFQQEILGQLRKFDSFTLLDPSLAFTDLAKRGIFPRGFANTQPGVGHLNPQAHKILGQLLADLIKSRLSK